MPGEARRYHATLVPHGRLHPDGRASRLCRSPADRRRRLCTRGRNRSIVKTGTEYTIGGSLERTFTIPKNAVRFAVLEAFDRAGVNLSADARRLRRPPEEKIATSPW